MGDYAEDAIRNLTRYKPKIHEIPTVKCPNCGDVINKKTYSEIKNTCCERAWDNQVQ